MKAFLFTGITVLLLTACGGAAPAQSQSSAGPTANPSRAPASASAKPASSSPASAAGSGAAAKPAATNLTTVKLGAMAPAVVSDAGVIIADAKGWFAEQGIKLDAVPFDTAAKQVAPLGTNQLDVGSGSVGAGIFNAFNQGVEIQIVADKATTSPGHGYAGLVVRKDLVDSGKFKGPADLKGMKIASAGPTTAPEVAIADLLAQGKLTTKDVDIVQLAFTDMGAALANKSIDAAEPVEPWVTTIVKQGNAVLYKRSDEYAPNQQFAVLLYAPGFAQKTDLATKFMVAYLKGVRLYDDAFDKKDQTARAEVINILSDKTSLKEKVLYDQVVMPGLDPNGTVNVADLKAQEKYYLAAGEQKQPVNFDKLVNMSFAQAAAKQLGAYK